MIVRIAGRPQCATLSQRRRLGAFYSTASHATGRNIFLEAKEEEEIESKAGDGRRLLDEQRAKMAQEPVWDGEERLQDTVIRMIMDKYQPLRMKSGSTGQHPADVKLSSIQKPSMLSSPSLGQPSSSLSSISSTNAVIVDVNHVFPDLPPIGEDGRRLAKTPDQKPWAAVYVNPMKRSMDGELSGPSVHYGKYLGLPRFSSARVLPTTASGKERLKLAGIKTETLPIDDRNKMRAIREGVRRWDRAGRMRGVKEEAYNYRRMREEQRHVENNPMTEEELEGAIYQSGVLQEGEEMKRGSSSDSAPGEAVIAMSGGRGFTSVANERIEAAMKTDYFRRNALRGKPLERDIHAMNPFLGGEERIMNRLIQRQGASPPWVELNSQVESETNDWRNRLIDNWVRRASRMILSSSHLRRGLEPIKSDLEFKHLEEYEALSSGQRKLLNLANAYRDAEWVDREKDYHEASLKEVNNIIRKYNVVAPQSVRKGLLIREMELQRVFEKSRVALVNKISEGLMPSHQASFPSVSLSSTSGRASSPASVYSGNGSSSDQISYISNRNGAGIVMGEGHGDDGNIASSNRLSEPSKRERKPSTSYALVLSSMVRRIKEQIVGR